MTDDVNSGWLDLEKELTCSICTDILYQPLTLLDCLHTFCGSCLKEWFSWQADAAISGRAQVTSSNPYTCPQCRDVVRGTKADWRLTTLLEGYLRSYPDRGKTETEKEEMKKRYNPGDNVIPPVTIPASDHDSEDERLLSNVRELSMRDVGSRSTERRAGYDRRGTSHDRRTVTSRHGRVPAISLQVPNSSSSRTDVHGQLVGRQSSLRDLFSASPIQAEDVQQEILQSIYSEGLLDGIDIENLTPEQEEELTERIAEAYRRRHRRRDRSRNQERQQISSRSPQPTRASNDPTTPPSEQRSNSRSGQAHSSRPSTASDQRSSSRIRLPVSRPHPFEQRSTSESRPRTRASSAARQTNRTPTRAEGIPTTAPASRSVTDLSQRMQDEDAERQRRRRRRVSTETRTRTDPTVLAQQSSPSRPRSNSDRVAPNTSVEASPAAVIVPTQPTRSSTGPASHGSAPIVEPSAQVNAQIVVDSGIRSIPSVGALAPEPLATLEALQATQIPSVECQRCHRKDIQHDLHYHCAHCRKGDFDLCLACYRSGQGCDQWLGFGYTAYQRYHRLQPPEGWPTDYPSPHVLMPRRYHKPGSREGPNPNSKFEMDEGAFCEICFTFCDDYYWSCGYCLDGAWGFCKTCVHQGKHCTHPLLPLSHIGRLASQHDGHTVTSKETPLVRLPHLDNDPGYLFVPDATDCDLCHRPIPATNTRYHCYHCSDGNYDVCTECYYGLVATGKIRQMDGPSGWRKCLKGHRMVIVGYQDVPGRGQQRVTVRDPVGGWRYKEESEDRVSGVTKDSNVATTGRTAKTATSTQSPTLPPPADGTLGMRCLAGWNRFPAADVTDELAFPKHAEIREVETKNADWCLGVYAGKVGLFPSNHVRML